MTGFGKALGNHLSTRWRLSRLNGSSVPACAVNLALYVLLWFVFPLERGMFAKLRHNFAFYYPQIKPNRMRLLDPLRVVVQTVFLLFIIQGSPGLNEPRQSSLQRLYGWLSRQSSRLTKKAVRALVRRFGRGFTLLTLDESHIRDKTVLIPAEYKAYIAALILFTAFVMSFMCITQPLNLSYQFVFVGLMWVIALVLKNIKSRVTLLLLIFISLMISSRYIWWRSTTTVILEVPSTAIPALLLLAAEIYSFAVMVLSYFQVSWVLERDPYPLPADPATWPTVDVMIPTYNEPMEVVQPCLLAALDLDWPREKLKVHLLDDGSRPEFEEYCKSIGVNYIKRAEHNHAKAGNINHALTVTDGSLIAIFDCDHIPTRAFLQMTVGWLVQDPKIALVQTPHHFYSEDPFEKNLTLKGKVPAENSLFHDFIQKGNDMWNATMFCGSCAVIRRGPLEEIGGIAVETVTEDAHTSLRLNRKGYSSAFIGIPLAAGLSTESLADHINQRIRWARGMVQIFRIDNPLFGKGLTAAQRLCFTNAMIHFLHGLPRIIFLLAPLPYLFFNIYVIFASGLAILSYVLPHMVHANLTSQRIQGNHRYYFWGVIYETVLSWYIFVPTLVALISPKHGKFNVTSKGAENASTYFDWTVSKPYILLIILNFMGLVWGIYKLIFDPFAEHWTIAINLVWVSYNLLVLGAAAAVALESKQVRANPRVQAAIPATLELTDGHQLAVTVENFSQHGLGVRLPVSAESFDWNELLHQEEKVFINIRRDNLTYRFSCTVRRILREQVGLAVHLHSLQENIEYVRCTFATADRWTHDEENLMQDSLLHGIHMLVTLGLNGYLKMIRSAPFGLRTALSAVVKVLMFAFSLLPQPLDVQYVKIEDKTGQAGATALRSGVLSRGEGAKRLTAGRAV